MAPELTGHRRGAALDGLRLIALLKFGKALLLLGTAYGVHRVLNPAIAARLLQWSETITDRFERHLVLQLIDWLHELGPHGINSVLLVTLGYAALVVTEGIGLWQRRRWGEWLCLIATASLLPFEMWKLLHAHDGRRALVAGVLAVNILIVIYLWRQLQGGRSGRR